MSRTVLFVGSFKSARDDGSVGGQLFACQSLIGSRLSDTIEWLKIDSTAVTNKHRSFFARSMKGLGRVLQFLRILVTKRFDTALIFTVDGAGFLEKGLMALISKMAGKKVILAPRSGLIPGEYERSSFMRSYYQRVIGKVDHVVCQGEGWRDFYQMVGEGSDTQYTVIQNWLDADPYFQVSRKEEASDTLNILYMSWVIKDKGIFDLIDAVAGLSGKYPHVRLWVCGEGEASDDARAAVKEKGMEDVISFHGWVVGESKLEIMSKTDVYVLPSYFEGFPNSLMEAMAAGLPVVSTTVGSIPELVESGENGLLFTPRDVEGLTAALERLIVDDAFREQLRSAARVTIRNNNLLDVAVPKFETLLLPEKKQLSGSKMSEA